MALPEASILDLAPTLLHLLGEAVPRIMDGRVLTEALAINQAIAYTEDNDAGSMIEYGFKPAEAEQIEDRLRGLGYL